MDPDANLQEQLELARMFQKVGPMFADFVESHKEDVMRLAGLVIALNEWLSSGGFPPSAWDPRKA